MGGEAGDESEGRGRGREAKHPSVGWSGRGPGRNERRLGSRRTRMVVEKSELRNAEGRKLEPLMGNRVVRTTEQHGIADWTDYRDDGGA